MEFVVLLPGMAFHPPTVQAAAHARPQPTGRQPGPKAALGGMGGLRNASRTAAPLRAASPSVFSGPATVGQC